MRIIFHHPGEIESNGKSGSIVRPFKMLQAFRAIGCDVYEVAGSARDRKQAIKRILKEMSCGAKFAFLYSENRTIPTAMTERHHVPIYPFLDYAFFRKLKRDGVPIGLFYRDIFWMFPMYRAMLPFGGSLITKPFYYLDWYLNTKTIDHLFIPSSRMGRYLPTDSFEHKSSPLPPGCEAISCDESSDNAKQSGSHLKLFYVGGVTPPVYDIRPLFDIVGRLDFVSLVVCCRKAEWDKVESYYNLVPSQNISIVHATGDSLSAYYKEADIFAMVWSGCAYLDFAVPVKVYESVGWCLPIVALAGTEAASVVEREGFGWVSRNEVELELLLSSLYHDIAQIKDKKKALRRKRLVHTWEMRAESVVEKLSRHHNDDEILY